MSRVAQSRVAHESVEIRVRRPSSIEAAFVALATKGGSPDPGGYKVTPPDFGDDVALEFAKSGGGCAIPPGIWRQLAEMVRQIRGGIKLSLIHI